MTTIASLVVVLVRAPLSVAILVAITAAGQGVAYALIRNRRSFAGVIVSNVCLLLGQIGAEAILGRLGSIPFVVSIIILLAAATLPARWLPSSFGACLVVLAIEGWLSPWARPDQEAIATAAMVATVVFVVALLHVQGIEHAFVIAERHEQARSNAATAALESERRYRLIADSADDLIALVDATGGPFT
jgi:hypothetical protein